MIRNRHKDLSAKSVGKGFFPRPLFIPLVNEKHISVSLIVRVAFVAGMTCAICPASAGQFDPPGLEGFAVHSERDGDGDGDGVNETHIKQYMNKNGDSLVSMTSKGGRVWAWSLNTRDNESGESNYVIRDSDCDGIFDEVYSLDDDFHVPECVK